jgi:hypothetical protein
MGLDETPSRQPHFHVPVPSAEAKVLNVDTAAALPIAHLLALTSRPFSGCTRRAFIG